MNFHLIKISSRITVLFVFLSFSISGQVRYEDNTLLYGNDQFIKKIKVEKDHPGTISVSVFSPDDEKKYCSTDNIPFFEFVLNHQVITSSDKLWRYRNYFIRQMENGGTEIKIIIDGAGKPVKGLQVIIYQQFFPNTTLVRELLELKATAQKQFEINKINGKLHFKFPQYEIMSGEFVNSTEIRIASWAEEIIDVNNKISYDDRFQEGRFSDLNLAMNHMFNPAIKEKKLEKGLDIVTKGPVNIISGSNMQWIMAYEHASQDNLRGLVDEEKIKGENLILDKGQGTGGIFSFPVSNNDFQFLGFRQNQSGATTHVGIEAFHGAYLEGEVIDNEHPYSSVWTASAFSENTSADASRAIIHDYLWRCICEKPASRQPEFYYNTWGMQRRVGKTFPAIRDLMTEKNLIAEIRRAAELGVDIFVLDDGWEQAQGEWTPHEERLPNGLKPVREELDRHGIKMGLWFSPMGIDKTTQRYKDHPEWVIKDSEGNPVIAQWGHPAFDFVSGFYDLFVSDCKKMIDEGARFFKWDAINTFYSSLPGLHHGSAAYSEAELRARYEYLLPIYVTRAMKELTDYEPELVIEIDLTEARRAMIGLAVLSQGKYFWMNNGASGYNDYSTFRAKSMRHIPNRFAGIIPLELFTYANYPQNQNKSQRYNVNTSIIAGHGFWGNLDETSIRERETIKENVLKSKRVLSYVKNIITEVTGRVGSSPEIYSQVNREKGAGQIIAFSGSAIDYEYKTKINPSNVLGVLNNSYSIENDNLILNFQFPMADASREAFIIPNENNGISIIKSSCWLKELDYTSEGLQYISGTDGEQIIMWDKKNGQPHCKESADISIVINENRLFYHLTVKVNKPQTTVVINK